MIVKPLRNQLNAIDWGPHLATNGWFLVEHPIYKKDDVKWGASILRNLQVMGFNTKSWSFLECNDLDLGYPHFRKGIKFESEALCI